MSDVDLGTFASSTTAYTADVGNRVTETTVTPTTTHSEAGYVVKLGGVEDSDGEVSLSVGSNVITVEVTAEDGNATQTYTVTVTRAANSPATGTPTISGTAEVGETLTVDISGIADEDGIDLDGTHPEATYDYHWYASRGDCQWTLVIQKVYDDPDHPLYSRLGSANRSFEVPWDARGGAISVDVQFKDEGGDLEILSSAATAAVPGPIEDITLVDTTDQSDVEELDCDSSDAIVLDADGSYSVRIDLKADAGVGSVSWNIAKNGFSYTPLTDNTAPYSPLGEDDNGLLGRTLPVGTYRISGTVYSAGDDELQLFRAEFSVSHDNPATGAPTITGTAQVGQTLTASTTGISDSDGLTNVTYSYQWLADDTEIDGATSSTYTVQSSDNGKVIKVRVTFRDDEGTRESLTSTGTSAVVLGGL